MTEIPSCSYECDRPECIRAQRDELVSRMTAETSNARGSCYEGVCPDCNSLDCDCDAPLPSRRPAMTGKPIDEEAVAQVCDRMLTAAIGKDWRKRAPEAVTAFWMGEVREALQEAVRALTAAQENGDA